jgi:hypothetical protein
MPPFVIRYDRRRLFRSLAVAWVIGTLAAALMASAATQRRSLLAHVWDLAGVPPAAATFALVEGLTLAGVLYTFGHALRRPDRIRLLPEGVEVRDSLGTYRIDWDNVAGCGPYLDSMAGIRLDNPGELLETHSGSARQRQLLETREPVGGYDLVFSREQLDCGIERFLTELERFRQHPDQRAALSG